MTEEAILDHLFFEDLSYGEEETVYGGEHDGATAIEMDEELLAYFPSITFEVQAPFPIQAVGCARCHSTQFHVGWVGQSIYIKCPTCGWELGVS